MKYLLVAALCSLLIACSSEYTPSEAMLEIKREMTDQQALDVLKQRIWLAKGAEGICGSRGFWYDEKANMKFSPQGIDLYAYKRGKVTKKIQKKLGDILVFERDYYQYFFDFSKVKAVFIYDDPLLLPTFTLCNSKEAINKYFIIDVYQSEEENIKFIVYEHDFNEIMAAISLILKDVPVKYR